jgi:hypothetical protein
MQDPIERWNGDSRPCSLPYVSHILVTRLSVPRPARPGLPYSYSNVSVCTHSLPDTTYYQQMYAVEKYENILCFVIIG